MATTYVLKRKVLADLTIDKNPLMAAVNGVQLTGDAAKGVSGFVKNAGLSMASPVSVAGMVADNARGKIQGALDTAANTAKNYTPTVQNAYLQKSYGLAQIAQGAKEVGIGAAKGLWNNAKKNTGLFKFAAGMTAAMTGGTYLSNRYKRQKEEAKAGDPQYANGLPTSDKLAYGAAAAGLGATGAYMAAKSHDKKIKALEEVSNHVGVNTGKGSEGFIDKEGKSIWKKMKNTGLSENRPLFDKNDKPLLDFRGNQRFEKLSVNEIKDAANSKLTEMKGNKVMFGKDLGISNKAWKMGRNAAIGAGIVGGIGLAANHFMKKNAQQRNNSEVSQREFGYWSRAAYLAKKAGGIDTTKGLWSGVGDLIGKGQYGKAAKAVGTAIGRGIQSVSKTAANMSAVGTAEGQYNSMMSGIKNQGEYGKKVAKWIGKHPLAKNGVKLGGAVVVGDAVFKGVNKALETPMNKAISLDKKTAEYVKAKEEGIPYKPSYKPSYPNTNNPKN